MYHWLRMLNFQLLFRVLGYSSSFCLLFSFPIIFGVVILSTLKHDLRSLNLNCLSLKRKVEILYLPLKLHWMVSSKQAYCLNLSLYLPQFRSQFFHGHSKWRVDILRIQRSLRPFATWVISFRVFGYSQFVKRGLHIIHRSLLWSSWSFDNICKLNISHTILW